MRCTSLAGTSLSTWRVPPGPRPSRCFTGLNWPRPKGGGRAPGPPQPALVATLLESLGTPPGGHLELRSDCHPVVLGAKQLKGYPVIGVRCHITENPCFSIQDCNNDVHVSVDEQIADNRAAIWFGELHIATCLCRHILERHFAQVAEDRVRLGVVPIGEFRDVVKNF